MDPAEQVSPTPHLRMDTDSVSETLCSVVFFRIPEMHPVVPRDDDDMLRNIM
jgi:hypothetical protein